MKTFMMMVGLSGSGKSYLAKTLSKEYDAEVVSSDSVREELHGDESIQGKHSETFSIVHDRIIAILNSGRNVIFDATNIQRKHRISLLQKLPRDVKKVCYIVATDFETCLLRNKNRERVLDSDIINRQRKIFNIPLWSEGWDDIKFEYCYDSSKYFVSDYIRRANVFDQCSPYHSLTLGEHSIAVGEYVRDNFSREYNLAYRYLGHVSAILHDCGKEHTKTFKNKKGETTSIAHYYNHEFCGAYESLFYLRNEHLFDNEILFGASAIEFHMQMYNINSEKAKQKLLMKVGEKLYEYLELLHTADKNSH